MLLSRFAVPVDVQANFYEKALFDKRGEVVPRYEFWLPLFGGCAA